MIVVGTPLDAVVKATIDDQIAISNVIEDEVGRILYEKFGNYNQDELDTRLAPFLGDAIRIQIDGSLSGICRDPTQAATALL